MVIAEFGRVKKTIFIPKELQNLVFDCASIPTFAAASIDHVLAHGLLPRRLRLLQIQGASFIKNQILKFLGYTERFLLINNNFYTLI